MSYNRLVYYRITDSSGLDVILGFSIKYSPMKSLLLRCEIKPIEYFKPGPLIDIHLDAIANSECCFSRGRIELNVALFALEDLYQGKGLGRFIWAKYLEIIPFEISHKIYIKGELVETDEVDAENHLRRDSLWKDLIGFHIDRESMFQERANLEKGHFYGQLRSTWNPYKTRLSVTPYNPE